MAEQTKAYGSLKQDQKKQAGPPHVLAFMGMVRAIVARGVSVGQANHEAVKQYAEQMQDKTVEEMKDEVRLCKQAKGYESGKKKLYVSIMMMCPIRSTLGLSLVQMGFGKKMGWAPSGYMERDLAEWLEQL